MQENVIIKISCQNRVYNLHFAFWNLDLYQVFLLIVAYQNFQGSGKIELKTQLPSCQKKIQAVNFQDMKNPLYKFFLYKFTTKCVDQIFDLDRV